MSDDAAPTNDPGTTDVVSIDDNTHPSSEQPAPDAAPTMSKSAMKKAARRERMQAQKLERRAREKEVKREKKKIRAEKRAAGELDEEDEPPKKKQKRLKFGARVVIDLGFDDKMSEKEITSLSSQLAYTYSANRNANHPFSLLYTSLNGRTLTRLESLANASYTRWAKTEWWTEDYDHLWAPSPPVEQSSSEEASKTTTKKSRAPKESVVYLTADSDVELTELKPDETYILGGIVDRNRYKSLCLDKANESGIRTARLPIGRYMADLPTRKVLTVNQVFEIMLEWVESRDWEKALYAVMPKRKFTAKGTTQSQSSVLKEKEEEGGEDSDDKEAEDAEVLRTEDIEAAVAA